ncbi:tRNA (guanosine(37)-N1)-methyltransferase TrmD [Bdellovibrionota bacterium]
MMRYDIVTLFPDCFPGPLSLGIIGKAITSELIKIGIHNPRDLSEDKHRSVDDIAYGGGAGMVMTPQPLLAAIRSVRKPEGRTILLTPSGNKLTHARAKELSKFSQLVLVCGRYEGVDQRVIDAEIDEEISVGDFVMTGGELPAMMLIDCISRFIPGVVGNEDSPKDDSFVDGFLEYPHYTRPSEFEGMKVPEVLTSGDHAKIAKWRREESLKKTALNRPELLKDVCLTPDDQSLIKKFQEESHD